jgi:hypothetical protein
MALPIWRKKEQKNWKKNTKMTDFVHIRKTELHPQKIFKKTQIFLANQGFL